MVTNTMSVRMDILKEERPAYLLKVLKNGSRPSTRRNAKARRLPGFQLRFVRVERLELSRREAPDPKSGLSTISTHPQNGLQIYDFFGFLRFARNDRGRSERQALARHTAARYSPDSFRLARSARRCSARVMAASAQGCSSSQAVCWAVKAARASSAASSKARSIS